VPLPLHTDAVIVTPEALYSPNKTNIRVDILRPRPNYDARNREPREEAISVRGLDRVAAAHARFAGGSYTL